MSNQTQNRPRVVCMCGSSKFAEHHAEAMMSETLKGHIVIPLGLYGHADVPVGAKRATDDADENGEVKKMLNRLHLAKIDMSDDILVVNPGSYIGTSTKKEIAHALRTGKRVRYTHPMEDRYKITLCSAKGWRSCAKWPEGLLTFSYADHDNTTRDVHDTKEQADGVCRKLLEEGLGGERCHFPVRVWSEPVCEGYDTVYRMGIAQCDVCGAPKD